jgi:biopolymer transport protein ExbD
MDNAMESAFSEEEAFDEPLINLTPLIDVVFVVLITFMIIAPVLDTDRVQLAPGLSHAKERISTKPSEPLTIIVHADNTIWVSQRKITLQDLGKWLQKEKKLHPRSIPKLIHDSRAHFGTYQTVKNTVESCGFEEMDVILQPH